MNRIHTAFRIFFLLLLLTLLHQFTFLSSLSARTEKCTCRNMYPHFVCIFYCYFSVDVNANDTLKIIVILDLTESRHRNFHRKHLYTHVPNISIRNFIQIQRIYILQLIVVPFVGVLIINFITIVVNAVINCHFLLLWMMMIMVTTALSGKKGKRLRFR